MAQVLKSVIYFSKEDWHSDMFSVKEPRYYSENQINGGNVLPLS